MTHRHFLGLGMWLEPDEDPREKEVKEECDRLLKAKMEELGETFDISIFEIDGRQVRYFVSSLVISIDADTGAIKTWSNLE